MSTVAVVGPGAIGLTCAVAAHEAGHEVVLCGRRPLGGTPTIEYFDGRLLTADLPSHTDPAELSGPVDLVLLAVKAHQIAASAGWLEALCGPQTVVAALQNGVEHHELVEPLAGNASVLPVAVWFPAETIGPGRVFVAGSIRMVTESGDTGERLRDLIGGALATIELADDLPALLWRKLLPTAVVGLTVLSGIRGTMFSRPEMAELGAAYARECAAVGRAHGVDIPDAVVESVVELVIAHGGEKTSMLVDREAGRELEWDVRNGVIRRLGVHYGIPTPISDVVVPLLAAASDGDREITPAA